MKRLISLAAVMLAALVVSASAEEAPGPAGTTWSHPPPANVPTMLGGKRAVCTLKRCRYSVSCIGAPADSEQPCIVILALYGPLLITRPTENVVDPETGEPLRPWPATRGVIVPAGESRTLVLKVIGPGRAEIRKRIRLGKRSLKGGAWEMNTAQFVKVSEGGLTSPPVYEFLYQYGYDPGIGIRIK